MLPAHLLETQELTLLQHNRWLAGCAPALRDYLLAHGRRCLLGSGQTLFERGGVAHDLCCVLSGALRVGALHADGSVALLAWLEPGQWFGEISLIDGLPRTHDVVAEGPTSVWLISHAELQDWLNAHPQHWRAIAQLACIKLRNSFEALEDMAHLNLEQRLAKRLLLVASGYAQRAEQLMPTRLRLPQEQLALMLGVSRQTVNKALKALEAQRLLALHYGEIELLDLAALELLARPG
ncbi:Crp/Fnr family transcriptional regulator [Paucibacter sp. APW11]|uniref:Crp/Fnr family transcriptional regulator n=1 Tax=Roseateles aquae TaxID=3077235 RepID=A0ABU3P9I7_9BURK|nr:Crp/Fnr family transcriptional regulator [Paucibacter sp. APW11]MDT8999250.1 Crp/Fnr family transcriptional regulator [Paucibacter sp. APW11]